MNTKNNLVKLNGVVIGSADYKEYDVLLTILSKERGKIKAYAFNVRKANSKVIGKIRLFTFGTFELRENKDSYQLENVVLKDSFDKLSENYVNIYYASYFVELANFFEFENMECEDTYNLLYYTFKALVDDKVPQNLIRRVYELKMLEYQGIYKDSLNLSVDNQTLKYTWDFVLNTLPQKLYSFKLSDEIYDLFDAEMSVEMREKVGKKFKTLAEIEKL